MLDFTKMRKKNMVLVPVELIDQMYTGPVYGTYCEESGVYNIMAWDKKTLDIFKKDGLIKLGEIVNDAEPNSGFYGLIKDNTYSFFSDEDPLTIEKYTLMKNVFSRNTGILETNWMLEKSAIIIGCGSVGSLVALELAKAGVGRFILVDNDIVEYHNICRHQCGVFEVGQYKVHALDRRIRSINPTAKVGTHVGIAESMPKDLFDEFADQDSIMVGCADNREADVYVNSVAVKYQVPFISIGFWERAFAGEIFYYLPEKTMPCYKCALASGSAVSERTSTNRRLYTNEEDLLKVNFEPGISIDINFVTVVGIKLIIDILNRNNSAFTPKVINHLKQFTLVCNSNNPKIGGEMAEIFAHPLQITHSLDVGFSCSDCPPCKFSV